MDAAIAGDYLDFKFKNNTEYPIYIEGYVSGGKITFALSEDKFLFVCMLRLGS